MKKHLNSNNSVLLSTPVDNWPNTPENVCKEHPISIINFDFRYVFRSFLVDNFRIVNNSSISIHAQPAKVLIEGDLNGDAKRVTSASEIISEAKGESL